MCVALASIRTAAQAGRRSREATSVLFVSSLEFTLNIIKATWKVKQPV